MTAVQLLKQELPRGQPAVYGREREEGIIYLVFRRHVAAATKHSDGLSPCFPMHGYDLDLVWRSMSLQPLFLLVTLKV